MSSSDEEQTTAVEAKSPDAPSRKRKTLHDGPGLEIDLDAPEPPSKKALRKLKKQQKAEKKAAKEKKQEAATAKKDSKKEKKEKKSKKEESDRNSSEDEDIKPKKQKTSSTEKDKESKKSRKAAEEDAASKSKRSNYGVWIGNLSFYTTKSDLRTFITSRAGLSPHNITRLHMPEGTRNAAGKTQNKGFAYVDFDKPECVKAVVALSESDFNGRRCLIKDALSFEGRPAKKEGTQGTGNGDRANGGKPASRKIFVGNLAYDINKETLEMHFAKCGTISNIHVATFEDSGKCKGYAWVEFEDIGSAEAAVRGFVKVPEEEDSDEGEEEEDESSSSSSDDEDKKSQKKKSKRKPAMKKVWVNRLFGRPLRMEFAEDSETRYNKRFGKGAKRPQDDGGKADDAAITEVADGAPSRGERKPERKKAKYNTSRYSEQTVQRLTGGIVEAQGKKISFD